MKFILNENKKFVLEERFNLKEENTLIESGLTPAEKLKLAIGNVEPHLPKILGLLPKCQDLALNDDLKGLCANLLADLQHPNLKEVLKDLKADAEKYPVENIGKIRGQGILGLLGEKIAGNFQSINASITRLQMSTVIPDSTLEKLKQKVVETRELLTELHKWIKDNKPGADSAIDSASVEGSSEEDWAIKYAKAVNKEVVFDTYLMAVWTKKVGKEALPRLRAIRGAFSKECEAEGFDDTNPFFEYIKEVYLKMNSMSPATYKAIHNAVVDGDISLADIEGKGGLQKCNLIFCKHFVTQEPAVVKLYLKKQKQLLSKPVPKREGIPEFKSKIDFVCNVLYKNKEGREVHYDAGQTSTAFELNSLAEINKREKEWTGSTQKTKTASEVDLAFLPETTSRDEKIELAALLSINFKLDPTKLAPEIQSKITELKSKSYTAVEELTRARLNLYTLTTVTKDRATEIVVLLNTAINEG